MPPDPVFTSPDPFNEPTPLIEFGPQPAGPKKDTCTCPKKKKKKKKPTDRTTCYRGTYKQNKRGITFTPKEQVPCEAKGRSVSKRETASPGRRRTKTPTWQDTLNDVFYFTH